MLKKLEPNSFKKAAECPVHRPFRTTHLFILATLLGFTCLSQTNITQAAPLYADRLLLLKFPPSQSKVCQALRRYHGFL